MELIEALEKLSLQVKFAQKSNQLGKPNISNVDYLAGDLKPADWQPSSSHINTDQGQHQLKEFNDSIDTLFTQITDLESYHPDRKPSSKLAQSVRWPQASLNVHNRASLLTSSTHFGGSLETSQEEDSDNSSQQSGYASQGKDLIRSKTDNSTDQLVDNLMKRDLNAITNTVRKIGQILAAGKEIEANYKKLDQIEVGHFVSSSEHLNYLKTLCNTFLGLCTNEPYLCDLPTIVGYNEYCIRMLHKIEQLAGLSTSLATTSASETFDTIPDDSHGMAPNSARDETMMCLDAASDAIDCALLESEQQNVNWTDNKLYVDHQSMSPK